MADKYIDKYVKHHYMLFDSRLLQMRSLVIQFALFNLKARYRNSVLGFLWTFLEPLMFLSVLYLVFSTMFGRDIQYFPLYLLLGIIMWRMFSTGTTSGMGSIKSQKSVMTSVNIPMEIPVLSSVLTTAIITVIEMSILGIFLVLFQVVPTVTVTLLPLVMLLCLLLVLGVSLPLSVLCIKYHDVQFIWNVVIHVGFFINPIFYTTSALPEFVQNIVQFIPTVYIIDSARDVTLYGVLPSLEDTIRALCVTLVVFLAGYGIFWKLRHKAIEEL